MAEQVLQINFTFNVTTDDYRKMAKEMAGAFAEVEGLRWKVWIENEANKETGGIYLFESETALQSYLGSDLAKQVQSHPALANLSAKRFDVMPEPTRTCRGPVG
jgi:hypothetical protein